MYGFIYFMENESMPGLVKIGHTRNHPMERARQLSASTSCPTKFTILAYFGSAEASATEREIHELISSYRVNDAREFFNPPYGVLQDIMRRFGDPASDAFYDALLDLREQEEGKRTGAFCDR